DDRLLTLRTYLGLLGLELTGGTKPTPADYAALSESIKERADVRSIQTMMLRSMSQAVYQADNLGHFGLNYEAYTHFTSPIRRYPDLLVHRAIRYLIRGEGRPTVRQAHRVAGSPELKERKIYGYTHADMDGLGDSCSLTERRADEATRDVEAWLKCQYVEQHLGEPFEGVVTAVTSFGLFVELQGLFVDGLVHISGLGQDYFVHDMEHQAIIGERTGRVFRLGDTLKVRVSSVNLEQRKIDLSLDESAARQPRKKVERNEMTELEMQLAQLPPIELGGRPKPKSAAKVEGDKSKDGKSAKDGKESDGKAKKKRRPPVSKGKRIRQKKSSSAAAASGKPASAAAKKPKKPKKPKKNNAKPKAKD
ncbi:MAG: RNB domain-containing ribonuclease, partial [Gammaproteobacteria bacterium]|nr:RNB domain-containing ribonuclease [Gammaproteobacteria bacterium]